MSSEERRVTLNGGGGGRSKRVFAFLTCFHLIMAEPVRLAVLLSPA